MHDFRAGIYGAKFGERFRLRIARQETDEQFAGINIAAFGERISRNNFAHFGGGAVNDARAEAEFKFNGFFDACGKSGKVAVAGTKDDVAAIDVSLAPSEFQRFVDRAQLVHFDLIAADHVDATEQGDNGGHGAEYTTKNR